MAKSRRTILVRWLQFFDEEAVAWVGYSISRGRGIAGSREREFLRKTPNGGPLGSKGETYDASNL
ncbi:MAG: hypothetical protein OJF50_002559 [Nitrospira sp.]|jgi:hypothetical protein|nr:hypothetical protein [Nitrospira sp.]